MSLISLQSYITNGKRGRAPFDQSKKVKGSRFEVGGKDSMCCSAAVIRCCS
jgi:hypothetical protein